MSTVLWDPAWSTWFLCILWDFRDLAVLLLHDPYHKLPDVHVVEVIDLASARNYIRNEFVCNKNVFSRADKFKRFAHT